VARRHCKLYFYSFASNHVEVQYVDFAQSSVATSVYVWLDFYPSPIVWNLFKLMWENPSSCTETSNNRTVSLVGPASPRNCIKYRQVLRQKREGDDEQSGYAHLCVKQAMRYIQTILKNRIFFTKDFLF
jgi:hypothetical protein